MAARAAASGSRGPPEAGAGTSPMGAIVPPRHPADVNPSRGRSPGAQPGRDPHDGAIHVPPQEPNSMPGPSPRRLLPIVLAYLPVPIAGAALSARWGVGASPDGGPRDMVLRGTALTPPLFLPVVLVAAAAAAPEPGNRGRLGAALVAL